MRVQKFEIWVSVFFACKLATLTTLNFVLLKTLGRIFVTHGGIRFISACAMVFGIFKYRRRACSHALFLRKAERRFLHFLEIVTSWLVSSVGQKIPVQLGWYLPLQKVLLAENRFLQAGKGAENTKENFWQPFLWWVVCSSTVLVENWSNSCFQCLHR